MFSITRLVLPILALVGTLLAEAHEFRQGSKLRILTDETFEHDTQASTGSTTGPWFVMFYAPWCGHCQRLLPTWEDLADEMYGQVNVAAVDITANTEVGSRFTIKRLPTLYMINDGKVYRYGGQRTLEALSEFASSPEVYIAQAAETMDVPQPPSGLKHAWAQAEKLIQSKFVRDHPIIVALCFSGSMFVLMAIAAYAIFLCTSVSDSDAEAEVKRRIEVEKERRRIDVPAEGRAVEKEASDDKAESKKEK
ncbi:protein disulfide isomerase, putative [Perkinsus marinus ATCC 50983]|uniref:Protein disulfide isomerase, putative n=1 Tax=Perkinsus marinus (strain ATCC 50983 / TXsc) TaxID=423536 RepID=C5KAH2_PERM5|nr:protein disulfide isomerase, putative [Perkinsus marinus ATCC 50983]EER18508.1 protein disulfide isomerase, putative [Perkinsus marinus ATCC 50983]|eukprot:XP_002786712.1 protein disulfide isomerase, putative [Perkinsus marinus ATCC 50983]